MDSSDAPLVQIINGPNLNLLGVREPEIYGTETLGDIETACAERAEQLGLDIDFRQSNLEGDIVDWIQEARLSHDGADKIVLQHEVAVHPDAAAPRVLGRGQPGGVGGGQSDVQKQRLLAAGGVGRRPSGP